MFSESIGLNQQQQQYLTYFLVGSICFWLIVAISRTINRLRRLPNGPWGLPILGYLPFIKRDNYLQFLELSKKYGPVFSVKLGQHDVVVLNDWPSIKEALAKEELLARPDQTFFPEVDSIKSFGEMSGPDWRDHRRVAMRVLRDIGLGKSAMVTLVETEIAQFISELDKYAKHQKPCDFANLLGPSVSNNISIFLFGHKFDYDDPQKMSIDTNIDTFVKIVQFAGITIFVPFLGKILAKLGLMKHDEAKRIFLENYAFYGKEIDNHLKNPSNENEIAVDYIDGFLKEKRSRETRSNDKSDVELFDHETLKRNLGLFFGAGSETVKSTLCWAVLLLLKEPKYQDKIREEIHSVFGVDGIPNYDDRTRLPFTMAFLNETQRYGSVIAVNLLRRASKDVTIGSQTIPKDTIVILNFYAVHHDPSLWQDPEKFDPQRFLSEDGSKVTKPPYLIPFSGGKRICPGEGLANVELFLYLTTILQRFQIKSSENGEINMECEFGISRRPKYLPSLVFKPII